MRSPDPSRTVSYGSYLQLDRLLSSQNPPDYAQLRDSDRPDAKTRPRAHHDELLFIVVHQVFELWFKVILQEMRLARDLLGRQSQGSRIAEVPEEHIPRVVAALDRVNEILQVATHQWRVVETIDPTSFLDFRDLIIPASGFQSVQFRELEILAGLPENLRVDFEGTAYATKLTDSEQERLKSAQGEMTLHAALLDWLGRTPIEEGFPGFADAYLAELERYVDEQSGFQDQNPNLADSQRLDARLRLRSQLTDARNYLLGGTPARNRAHQAFVFIASYRTAPLLRWPSTLIDALIEFEQNFRIFRFRHARMVERMIGARIGTGGSPGVHYLDHTTSRYRIFGELLEARSFLLAHRRLPPLPHPSIFDFRRQ